MKYNKLTGYRIKHLMRSTLNFGRLMYDLDTDAEITESDLDNLIIKVNPNNHEIEIIEIPFGDNTRYSFKINGLSFKAKVTEWKDSYFMKINLLKYILNH